MQSCKNLFPACKLFAPQQENSPGRLWKRDKTRHTMPAPGQTICQATHNRPVVFFPAAEQASWKPRRLLRAGLCNYAENPASYIRGWVSVWKFCLPFFPKKDIQIVRFPVDHGADGHEFALDAVEDHICYSISSRLDEAGTSFCFGSVTRRTPSAYAALMPAASMPEISKLLA